MYPIVSVKFLIIVCIPLVCGECDCGREGSELKRDSAAIIPKLNGWEEFAAHKYPWLTFLKIGQFITEKFCTGSLISRQHVITAAHCVTDKKKNILPVSHVTVCLGAHNMAWEMTPFAGYAIKSIKIGDQYKTGYFHADIAILTLEQPVALSNEIYPICLPMRGEKKIPNHSDLTMAGWGEKETSWNPLYEKVFNPRKGVVNYIQWQECRGYWPGLKQDSICAVGLLNHVAACAGDSGGPLMYRDTVENRWYLMGVTSYSLKKPCEDKYERPSVFVDVTFYQKEIMSNASGACYPNKPK